MAGRVAATGLLSSVLGGHGATSGGSKATDSVLATFRLATGGKALLEKAAGGGGLASTVGAEILANDVSMRSDDTTAYGASYSRD